MNNTYDLHSWSKHYREEAPREASGRHLVEQANRNRRPHSRPRRFGFALSGALSVPQRVTDQRIGTSTGRRMWMMFLAALLAVVAAMVVSATQPKEANATVPGVPVVTIYVWTTCDGGNIQVSSAESRILSLHNQTRAAYGLPRLCVHPALTNAARSHSQDMLDKGYFSHTAPNGETVQARLHRFGYPYWKPYGENIYMGSGTGASPDSAFNGWMNSAEHKANILKKEFSAVGVGVRTGTHKGIAGTTMYTVNFGVR
jgi:uncharacterized protein YkwD